MSLAAQSCCAMQRTTLIERIKKYNLKMRCLATFTRARACADRGTAVSINLRCQKYDNAGRRTGNAWTLGGGKKPPPIHKPLFLLTIKSGTSFAFIVCIKELMRCEDYVSRTPDRPDLG